MRPGRKDALDGGAAPFASRPSFLEDAWFDRAAAALKRGFEARGVAVEVLF